MDGPRAWRWTLAGLVAAHAIGLAALLVNLGLTPFDLYDADHAPWIVAGLVLVAWVGEHARRAPWGFLPLAGVLAAAAFAWWSGHTAYDREDQRLVLSTHEVAMLALMWCSFTVPPALLAAQRAWREAALAAGGCALVLLSAGKVADDYATSAFGQYRSDPLELAMQVAGAGAMVAALVLAWRRPTPLPPARLPVPASTLAGVALLALSWALGGQLSVLLPLWIVAILVIALPGLLAWRHRPLRAIATLALLVVGGLVPAAECTYPFVTDAPREDDPDVARVEDASLWRATGRGPWWYQDDLMASYPVRCEPRVPALGVAWVAALAIVAAAPLPEPAALRRLTGRA